MLTTGTDNGGLPGQSAERAVRDLLRRE